MTKRKPKRDANGHFLPRGQTPRERSRPDTPPSTETPKERPDAPSRCAKCGEEEHKMVVYLPGDRRLTIICCQRCIPDPLAAIAAMIVGM